MRARNDQFRCPLSRSDIWRLSSIADAGEKARERVAREGSRASERASEASAAPSSNRTREKNYSSVDSTAVPTRTYPVLSVCLDVGHGDRWRELRGWTPVERMSKRIGERGRAVENFDMRQKKAKREEEEERVGSFGFFFFPIEERLDFERLLFVVRGAKQQQLRNLRTTGCELWGDLRAGPRKGKTCVLSKPHDGARARPRDPTERKPQEASLDGGFARPRFRNATRIVFRDDFTFRGAIWSPTDQVRELGRGKVET